MSFLKEFQYTNISARRALYANTFLTAAAITYIFAEISISLKYYFFYMPVFKTSLISAMAVFLLGSIVGRLIFTKLKWYRPLYLLSEIMFIIVVSIFLLRGRIWTNRPEILLSIFEASPFLLLAVLALPFFFSGIKTNYLLKTSCGDFIDEKRATLLFYIFILAGTIAGISLKFFALQAIIPDWISILFTVLILPLLYYFDLPYSPQTQYAREYEGEQSETDEQSPLSRENLILHYMQFSIPVIYIYSMYICILATQGNTFHNKLVFFLLIIFISLAGFIAGNAISLKRWSPYIQISYPPLFFIPMMVIFHFGNEIIIQAAILLFSPLIFLTSFGFSQAIKNILVHYRQDERFNIIQLSIFIMPAILTIILTFVPFTNFWFVFVIYFITMVNLILPGLFIVNKKTIMLKKALYFGYALIFIAIIIFSHFIVPVPFNNNYLVTHIKNFDSLKNINYNAPYIKVETGIEIDGRLIFSVKDSTIRNLKRALAPVSMYYSEEGTSKVLFIDGNQKFFRNPGIGYFKRSTCLDPLSDKMVDFETLPFSGRQTYVPDSIDPLMYFRNKKQKYQIITDIPNILDQGYNDFRFSEEYYALVKENLASDGIFAQYINIPGCSQDLFASMARNMKKCFEKHSIYLFSDVMIILATSSGQSLEINAERYNNLTKFIASQNQNQPLFFDEQHALSHLLFNNITALINYLPQNKSVEPCCLKNSQKPYIPATQMIETYLLQNNNFLGLFDRQPASAAVLNSASIRYEYNKDILSYLKATEFYESRNNYEKETEFLFNLKKRMDYHVALKEYMVRVLEYKEVSYFETAKKLIEEKQWERAKRLYQSILWINKDNFEANYQLGIISMTIQDIDGAAGYLQNAMRLKNNDPRVYYQMGVLEFTKGNIPKAIEYFTQALNQKETGSSLYLYLGMSYEEMGNIAEAENYYTKAQMADPNDANIQTHLDNIKKKKEEELKKYQVQEPKNQLEDEQDVDIPIPVNKSAYDVRLSDEGQDLNTNKPNQPSNR